ncbi:bifunctional DNA-binding transcriptional regulator/O6-methylguanine-DNA methyltransferase Ada [Nitrosovibrio sp. Nv4]|uniref:bifunctional DNA-binding transcriptional regulator/O6-methylguanine-DNA methyltransferase Ada n=1 Tax=Nitrosovibrio sp. Nv4 TaxID=1945880 RepID=UPI000BDD04CD|nr:bifunctional DNA-binding transcriptional regulator/O6-methylguanine-DNA methyltransferase Ada [Nitrosovibrio sp. Nv4]SOD41477.1 AraC family transcriptional regulator, regulatory protein of adaptative response / methylated-DNA-[protein]-cysteine methyltransferase [Nitrosovibrio sp. Nv4]
MTTSAKKGTFAAETIRDPRWAAVGARDPDADGKFYYAVKTTGVYCRPSCAARPARPENVGFYTTCEEAEEAGFRPCKRCQPSRPSLAEQHAAKVTQACRLIEASETVPVLEDLAREVAMSAYHFHRVFKQVTGLMPRQYAMAQREKKVRLELDRGRTVTCAIFNAGYNSSSRFYEKSNKVLGMTPSNYRVGGADTEIRFAIGECSLGSILVAQSDRGICAILLGNDPDKLVRDLQDSFPRANLIGGDADFEQLVARVIGFIEGPCIGFDLPLDVRGTAFQQRVWQALRDIPIGQTASYTEIARRIGSPNAARAVAQACAANMLAVAIPCHRVVRQDGVLSGYRWGIERKRSLLEAETEVELKA